MNSFGIKVQPSAIKNRASEKFTLIIDDDGFYLQNTGGEIILDVSDLGNSGRIRIGTSQSRQGVRFEEVNGTRGNSDDIMFQLVE